MLRERAVGESLWESLLPAELRELPSELRKFDEILDEDRFLAPFRARLRARLRDAVQGGVRLVYVAPVLRIGIEGRVPDPSTLIKLTKRLGPGLLEELNAELLNLTVERKVLRSRRLRVDTTIVEADIRSPTDSGLCAHAVSRLTRLAKRAKAAGLAPQARLRDRRRSVGKRVRAIPAARAAGEARARGGARHQLERERAASEQVLAQTDLRLAGQRTIPDRRISLVDPDARPVRMGRPNRPTEFGYKARIADTAEGSSR